jgi:hypothetical protein
MTAPTKAQLDQALCVLALRAAFTDAGRDALALIQAELKRQAVIVDEARHVVDDYVFTGETSGLARLRTRVYPPKPMQSEVA